MRNENVLEALRLAVAWLALDDSDEEGQLALLAGAEERWGDKSGWILVVGLTSLARSLVHDRAKEDGRTDAEALQRLALNVASQEDPA